MTLIVKLFGEFELRSETGLLISTRPREAALVAIVALNRGKPVSRHDVAELLWVSGDGAHRQHSLSQLLYRLRRHAGNLITACGVERIRLATEIASVDYIHAEEAIEYRRPLRLATLLEARLLGGYPDSPTVAYDQWRDAAIAEFERRALPILRSGMEEAFRASRWNDACTLARSALVLDPLAYDAHSMFAKANAAAGRWAEALSHLDAAVAAYVDSEEKIPEVLIDTRQTICAASERPTPATTSEDESLTPLRGRIRELHSLRSQWEQCRNGGSGITLVTGPSGIGKTRLATEIGRIAAVQGARVVQHRCNRGNAQVGFSALVSILTEVVAVSDPEGWPEPLRALLTPDGLGNSYSADLGGSTVRTIAAGLVGVLRSPAGRRGLVMILDNLEWSDDASRSAFEILAQSEVKGLQIVVIARAEYLMTSVGRRFRRELPAAIELDLEPLADGAAAELIGDVVKNWLVPPSLLVQQRILQQAGGSPLFIIEALRSLEVDPTSGEAFADALARNPRATLQPAPVQALLMEKLRGLPSAGRRLVATLAVAGRSTGLAVLCDVAKLRPAKAVKALDELAGLRMVRPVGAEFELAHDLLRETALNLLGPAKTRLIHQRLATSLESQGNADPGWLASHFAASGFREPAARYASIAAARNQASAALSSAEYYLRLAADNSEGSERVQAFRSLAKFYCEVGRLTDAAQLLPEFRELAVGGRSDDELLIMLLDLVVAISSGKASNKETWASLSNLLAYARKANLLEYVPRISGSLIEVAHDVGMRQFLTMFAQEIVQEAELVDGKIRAELLSIGARVACMHVGWRRGHELACHAVEVASNVGEPTVLIQALVSRATALLCGGVVHDATRDFDEIWRATSEVSLYHLRSRAVNNFAVALIEAGRFDEADAMLIQALATSTDHNRLFLLGNLGILALEREEPLRVESIASELKQVGAGIAWGDYTADTLQASALLMRGNELAALQLGKRLYENYDAVSQVFHDSSYMDRLIARWLVRSGTLLEAVAFLEERAALLMPCNVPAGLRLRVEMCALQSAVSSSLARRNLQVVVERAADIGLECIRRRALSCLAAIDRP